MATTAPAGRQAVLRQDNLNSRPLCIVENVTNRPLLGITVLTRMNHGLHRLDRIVLNNTLNKHGRRRGRLGQLTHLLPRRTPTISTCARTKLLRSERPNIKGGRPQRRLTDMTRVVGNRYFGSSAVTQVLELGGLARRPVCNFFMKVNI